MRRRRHRRASIPFHASNSGLIVLVCTETQTRSRIITYLLKFENAPSSETYFRIKIKIVQRLEFFFISCTKRFFFFFFYVSPKAGAGTHNSTFFTVFDVFVVCVCVCVPFVGYKKFFF